MRQLLCWGYFVFSRTRLIWVRIWTGFGFCNCQFIRFEFRLEFEIRLWDCKKTKSVHLWSMVCNRDERTVKFFSPSPILIRKNRIRSSSDHLNFWKSSVRSCPDPSMQNHVFYFASQGKICIAIWHFQNLTRQCRFYHQFQKHRWS